MDFVRQVRAAVKIAAERQRGFRTVVHRAEILDVADSIFDFGLCAACQKAGVQVNPADAAGIQKLTEQIICQVSGVSAQCARVGMARYHAAGICSQQLCRTAVREVGDIQNHAEFDCLGGKRTAAFCQAKCRLLNIRPGQAVEPVMRQPNEADARFVCAMEPTFIASNHIGAFNGQNRRNLLVLQGLLHRFTGAAQNRPRHGREFGDRLLKKGIVRLHHAVGADRKYLTPPGKPLFRQMNLMVMIAGCQCVAVGVKIG